MLRTSTGFTSGGIGIGVGTADTGGVGVMSAYFFGTFTDTPLGS